MSAAAPKNRPLGRKAHGRACRLVVKARISLAISPMRFGEGAVELV